MLHSKLLLFIIVGVHFGTHCFCIDFEILKYVKLSP